MRGLFNLRGTPVALVDPAKLLGLPEPPMNDEPRPGRPLTALVLRTENVLMALLIRRMEMVITRGRGSSAPPRPATPSTRWWRASSSSAIAAG